MKQKIADLLLRALESVGVANPIVKIEYPENPENGDFSSNAALMYAKQLNTQPVELAGVIVGKIERLLKDHDRFVDHVSIAGPGFINFKINDEIFARNVVEIDAGTIDTDGSVLKTDGTILVEYTDPNTFKAFHIGHMMSNAIGESISRLIESVGTKVIRICYPSDIGLHIAKSIWSMEKHIDEIPSEAAAIVERTAFLGRMYVEGTDMYESDPTAKNEIDELNQTIYDGSDEAVNSLYEKGKRWSLDHFDQLYRLLGTRFDRQIFESEVVKPGMEIVRANTDNGLFERSDDAIVFKGEKYGLHTRVFINSRGLPTYETKDIGLNMTKFELYPDTVKSIIITANEQNDYFRVLIKALSLIDEDNGSKTIHISHGMLRFATGKMSSRTGNVVTADSLIGDMKKLVLERIASRGFSGDEADSISDIVAIGAIKYTILRQAIGGNVIFDSASSISFEGDSGPYLQYSAVRAASILERSKAVSDPVVPNTVGILERLIARFPDITTRAREEYAPHIVANYLTALAGAFNSFYASQTIIDEKDPLSSYRVSLTRAFFKIMKQGLWLLGIEIPKKM